MCSLGGTAESLHRAYMSKYRLKIKSAFFARKGSVWSKISGTRSRPHQPFFVSDRINVHSCGIRMWAQISFVLSQSMRLTQTDRQTDGRTDGRTDGEKSLRNTMSCITCSRAVKTTWPPP